MPKIGSNVSSSLILSPSSPTAVLPPEDAVTTIPTWFMFVISGAGLVAPEKNVDKGILSEIFYPVPAEGVTVAS